MVREGRRCVEQRRLAAHEQPARLTQNEKKVRHASPNHVGTLKYLVNYLADDQGVDGISTPPSLLSVLVVPVDPALPHTLFTRVKHLRLRMARQGRKIQCIDTAAHRCRSHFIPIPRCQEVIHTFSTRMTTTVLSAVTLCADSLGPAKKYKRLRVNGVQQTPHSRYTLREIITLSENRPQQVL